MTIVSNSSIAVFEFHVICTLITITYWLIITDLLNEPVYLGNTIGLYCISKLCVYEQSEAEADNCIGFCMWFVPWGPSGHFASSQFALYSSDLRCLGCLSGLYATQLQYSHTDWSGYSCMPRLLVLMEMGRPVEEQSRKICKARMKLLPLPVIKLGLYIFSPNQYVYH